VGNFPYELVATITFSSGRVMEERAMSYAGAADSRFYDELRDTYSRATSICIVRMPRFR